MADTLNDRGGVQDWPYYFRMIIGGRWLIAGVVAGALAVGVTAILLTPRAYTAETTIEIDREPQRIVPVGPTAPQETLFSNDEFAQTQYGLLRGHALAVQVDRALGLDQDELLATQLSSDFVSRVSSAETEGRHDAVIRFLRQRLQIVPQRGSRLVAIRFSAADPGQSARIANAFAAGLIDEELEQRLRSSDYARDFLQQQLAAAKTKLEASERGLASYAASEGIIPLPGADGPGGVAVGRSLTADDLESFNAALAAARTDRIGAEQRWRQAVIAGPSAPEVLASPTVQQVSQDHARLAAEYQDRLSVFKPAYPDMKQLRARIDETDRQLADEAAAILTSLHARYAAALGVEQALAAQVASLRIAALDLRARSIRYTILQREVDTNRILYDGLLQRLRDVGVAGGVIADNIAIIDPATAPDHPSSPRPWLTLILSAMAGIALGVGATLARGPRDH